MWMYVNFPWLQNRFDYSNESYCVVLQGDMRCMCWKHVGTACVWCWIDCGWTLILPWRFLFCSFAFKHAWSPPYGSSFRCRREWLQWLAAWFNISTLPFICRSMMWCTSPYLSRVTTVIPHWPYSRLMAACPFQNDSQGAEPREASHSL